MSEEKPKYWGAKVRCDVCDTIVQSKHHHDFAVCRCWLEERGGIAVDGGAFYLRMCVHPKSKYTVLDEGNYAKV